MGRMRSDSRPKVLVIEDDADTRQVLVDLLEREGYWCAEASNGVEALSWLKRYKRPAVILLDLVMPLSDGFNFRWLQLADARLATIPVVVLTADLARVIQRLRDLPVLRKPFELPELLAVIESVVGFGERTWSEDEAPTWPMRVVGVN